MNTFKKVNVNFTLKQMLLCVNLDLIFRNYISVWYGVYERGWRIDMILLIYAHSISLIRKFEKTHIFIQYLCITKDSIFF